MTWTWSKRNLNPHLGLESLIAIQYFEWRRRPGKGRAWPCMTTELGATRESSSGAGFGRVACDGILTDFLFAGKKRKCRHWRKRTTRIKDGRASILLFHLSLPIPDPLSSCVRPVRVVHGRFPIRKLSSNSPSLSASRPSAAAVARLVKAFRAGFLPTLVDIAHNLGVSASGHCEGLHHKATPMGHNSVRFSLNLLLRWPSPSNHRRLHVNTSLTVFPTAFNQDMSHEFDVLDIEDLRIVDNCVDRNSIPRLPRLYCRL